MMDLVGKVREYVFHILCSECWDFWWEEEKEMNI